ncbi:MAG TPA: extensin family protein, partial [Sphingomonas sp.]|nr:extensin family protein [Sphingomonas sp.]
VRYTALPKVAARDPECGYADGVRLTPGGSRGIAMSPANLGTSCPVAAALSVWEWEVVQPAAQKHFGAQVAEIEHLGSYSCRRMYGRSAGDWSEHATADAIDVAGFRLADGTRIRVVKDWTGGGAKAAFLREVRTGACRLFSTVLSPDYNAAHRDHLHLDEAERGEMGWRACR